MNTPYAYPSHKPTHQQAFTLVELLIVIVVIAILAALSYVAYTGVTRRAQEGTAISRLSNLAKQVDLYAVENDTYPAYPEEFGGKSDTDQFVANGNRYCVSTTLDSGKSYRRIGGAEAITLEEGICGNIRPVYATAPESCFNFNSSLGAIQGYYTHQNNNPANPACPIDFTTPATIGGVGVREINNNVGPYNHGIRNVVLAEGVTAITGNGFSVASSLQSVYIPSTVTNIDGGGFSGTSLASAYVPASVSSLTGAGFGGLATLKSLSIGMDSTEESAPLSPNCGTLSGMTQLRYLAIGSNVIELCAVVGGISGHVAFQDGDKELVIASGSLVHVTLDSLTLPNRLKKVEGGSFHSAKIKKLVIKEGVVPLTINGGSFYHCSELESIDFPARTLIVNGSAFYGCSNLTHVTFKVGIQEISSGAFNNTGITQVSVPSATVVTNGAFNDTTVITRF